MNGIRNSTLHRVIAIIFTVILILPLFNISPVVAQASTPACALTPGQVDGQGFGVASLGFGVASLAYELSPQGFGVASLGFGVASLGFGVASLSELEDILQEIVDNETTPAWLLNPIHDVVDGANFGTQKVDVIVVDDFSAPQAHGFGVLKTLTNLLNAVDRQLGIAPANSKFNIITVNISAFSFDASKIAGEIKRVGDTSPNPHKVINMSFGLIPCNDTGTPTLVDETTGMTFTVNKPFNYNDYLDGPPSNPVVLPVLPVLECVEIIESSGSHSKHHDKDKKHNSPKGKDSYIAYFGYNNPNNFTVEIPIGPFNKFSPGPFNQGQKVKFAPGRYKFVFAVPFDEGSLTWKLGTKHAQAKGSKYIHNRCKGEIPELQDPIIPMGNTLGQHLTQVMGIPKEVTDEYIKYLVNKVQEDDDPFTSIQALMRSYLRRSYTEANDGNPATNFAVIPVASAGNFALSLGTTPLKPAVYNEVIAVSASVGDFGSIWRMSHFGNIIAPGVSTPVETVVINGQTFVSRIEAGTSHAAPYVSALSALWLTYPNACKFGDGLPPLKPGINKSSNAIFATGTTPLDCAFKNPPIITSYFGDETIPVNEGSSTTPLGTVSDPDLDVLSISTNDPRVTAHISEGVWYISAVDGTASSLNIPVEITVSDGEATDSVIIIVTIINLPPTATLTVSDNDVLTNESVLLSLINPSDSGVLDTVFSYEFDCDISDESDGSPGASNSISCSYPNAGTYTALALIYDKDGGFGYYTTIINVTSNAPVACYAQSVSDFKQGKQRDGKSISWKNSDPTKALGAPQKNDTQNYFSLGFGKKHDQFGGYIILDFGDYQILNANGSAPDFRVWETSFNDGNRPWYLYPEAVKVFASVDKVNWVHIGYTLDKDQAYDLGSLSYARYIKLIDITNPNKFSNGADGFDVDGVEGFSCNYVGVGE